MGIKVPRNAVGLGRIRRKARRLPHRRRPLRVCLETRIHA